MQRGQYIYLMNNNVAREIYASFVVYHGVLILGIDNAFSAYFRLNGPDSNITIAQESLIGAFGMYLRPGGSIIAMLLTDRIGRKRMIQLSLILYMISWSLIACSTSNTVLIAGRALSGISSGTQRTALLYVTEICDKNRRGRLVALRCVFSTFGASLPMIVAYYYSWRVVATVSVIVSAVGLIQMRCIPETKYWYVSKRQRRKAERSVRWFSRTATPVQVDEELRSIERSFSSRLPSNVNICRILRHEGNFTAFFVACTLIVLQRGCGRLAVISHMEHFFVALRTSYDSRTLVLVMGIVDFFASSLFALMVDKFKRKTVLRNTLTVLIFILISILGYDLVLQKFDISLPLLPVALLYAYLIICFTVLSTGILLVSTELICHENRGTILSMVFAVGSIVGATYSCILPYALEYAHIDVVFSYFLLNLILILVVVRVCVPETGGKDLHECYNIDGEEEVTESLLENK